MSPSALNRTTEVISVVCSRKVGVGANLGCTFCRLSPGIRGEGERMKVRGLTRKPNPFQASPHPPPLPCEERGDPYACRTFHFCPKNPKPRARPPGFVLYRCGQENY
jgi:hypothetical protein